MLPLCPGVYIMKNKDNDVIYVGKSKLLKNRVSSYFLNSANHTPKTVAMVSNISDFDYIITDTEIEALVLECNLIKKYRPKYNILLKDDKHYPYIKITVKEDFPRIYMTRKIVKDGAKYFGPYMSSYMVKETLETLRQVFKIRSCSKNLPRDIGKTRPCLYYHIKQCSAPCAGKISKEDYNLVFEQITAVLNGNVDTIISVLTKEMYAASELLEFEKAARLRDKIESLKILGNKQKMLSTGEDNRDIIGIYQDEKNSCVQIFYMRDGKISGSEYFVFDDTEASKEEMIEEFVKQYYFNTSMIAHEILLPVELEDSANIEQWLREKASHKISLLFPKRGQKAALVEMVNKNAEESLQKHRYKKDREQLKQNDILAELMRTHNLSKPPYRIESYDISNISGANSIGACVVYKNAKESKKDYRKFNIKTVVGADDYESMKEVIYRRINRAYEEEEAIKSGALDAEKAKFLPLPDLILVDGGKGHVSAIKLLMETLGEDIPVFGLVKDDKHQTRDLTDEYQELSIYKDGNLFKFLAGMQDEVHRYAYETFQKRHEKNSINSVLENIPGIGPSKRNKLLKTFISIDKIKNASYDELRLVVGKDAAKNIIEYFKERDAENE